MNRQEMFHAAQGYAESLNLIRNWSEEEKMNFLMSACEFTQAGRNNYVMDIYFEDLTIKINTYLRKVEFIGPEYAYFGTFTRDAANYLDQLINYYLYKDRYDKAQQMSRLRDFNN